MTDQILGRDIKVGFPDGNKDGGILQRKSNGDFEIRDIIQEKFTGSVQNFNALPDPSTYTGLNGDLYSVKEDQGSILSFNKKEAGAYRFVSATPEWVFVSSIIQAVEVGEKVTKGPFSDNQILIGNGTDTAQGSSATIDDNGNVNVLGEVNATVSGVLHKLSEKTNQEDFEKYFKFQNWKNTISGGGDITWSGNNLSTSNRLIVIPTNANEGYIQINLTNLHVSGWYIAYIDLTDAQLNQRGLTLTQDDFTVEQFINYTEATSQNRFVLGYHNADTNKFVFSNGLTVDNMNYSEAENGVTPELKSKLENTPYSFVEVQGNIAGPRYKLIGRLGKNDSSDYGTFSISGVLGSWTNINSINMKLVLMSREGLQSNFWNYNGGIFYQGTDIVVYENNGTWFVYLKHINPFPYFNIESIKNAISQGEVYPNEPWSATVPDGTEVLKASTLTSLI